MRLSTANRTRRGFTLVELLIGAAITVLIMTLLSYCFQMSMQAMGAMRAQGDAADQLRAVGEVMKRDIEADHFLPGDFDPNSPFNPQRSGRKVSDYRYDFAGGLTPSNGFFQVVSPPSLWEGRDGFMDCFRSPGGGVLPSLWFTSVLPGVKEDHVYNVTGGGTQYSECAEIAYFLSQQAALPQTLGGVPLFNLHRRQRLVLRSGQRPTSWPAEPTPAQVPFVVDYSIDTTAAPTIRYNTMQSLVSSFNNVPGRQAMPTALPGGEDIILSNVISFEVKPMWTPRVLPLPTATIYPRGFGNTSVTTLGAPDQHNLASNNASSDAPFDTLSAFVANAFDTISSSRTPTLPQLRIQAIQIRLRIYDPKAKTARQATFVFDL